MTISIHGILICTRPGLLYPGSLCTVAAASQVMNIFGMPREVLFADPPSHFMSRLQQSWQAHTFQYHCPGAQRIGHRRTSNNVSHEVQHKIRAFRDSRRRHIQGHSSRIYSTSFARGRSRIISFRVRTEAGGSTCSRRLHMDS